MASKQYKRYEELTFTDDFMFCKVLSNNLGLCKELLELILGIRIRKVVMANSQQTISITADAKSVRLDVYVEDDEHSIYDVEMETSKRKNLPKRSRYYQGMIDLNIIERGEKYEKLKKSFVIFICLKDPFGKGLHVYTFENRCREMPELILGDETMKVFVNAAGTEDDVSEEMKDFLHYLKNGTGESSLSNEIDTAVRKARAHVEWRSEYMTLQMKYDEIWEEAREDGLETGLKEGRKEGRKEGLKEGRKEGLKEGRLGAFFEMLNDGDISLECALKKTGLSEDDFMEKMKAYLDEKKAEI